MASTPLDQLAVAVKTRERYFDRIQKCFDLIKTPSKQKDFLVRCEQLSDTYAKFEEATDLINVLNTKVSATDEVGTKQQTQAFDDVFYAVKAHLATLLEQKKEVEAATAASVAPLYNPPPQQVKLPTINIPIFDGNISEFPSWKSLYDELVHNSPHVTDIQKFSYLRSYLGGSALQCVATIAFTAANYSLAYKSLSDRYGKKRTLASTLMNKLLEFKPLANDSVGGLRFFLDNFYVIVESMKSLTIQNLDEFMLVHLALKVLDQNSAREFEQEMSTKEFPTFADLIKFVKNKTNVLEQTAESCSSTSFVKQKPLRSDQRPRALLGTHVSNPHQETVSKKSFSPVKCYVCSAGPHKLSMCPKFQKLETSKRFTVVKDMRLCFACLSATHSASECQSTYRCRSCGSAKHHSLLHPANYQSSMSPSYHDQNPCVTNASTSQASANIALSGVAETYKPNSSHATILLGTAVLQIKDNFGQWLPIRCIIDPGSQVSIISDNLVQTLKLPRSYCGLQISGIGAGSPAKTRGKMCCRIRPCGANESSPCAEMSVEAVIMPKITSNLPNHLSSNVLKQFQHLRLADTTYTHIDSCSTQIELLLGAEYYADIVLHTLPILKGVPSAIPSIFGYLLLGRVEDGESPCKSTNQYSSYFVSSCEDDIANQLQKFWSLEDSGTSSPIIPKEDQYCEDHFVQTHARDSSGRYIVKLPFRENSCPLGSNREKAKRLFLSMERRLDKNPHLKQLYAENLQTYLDSDHMNKTDVQSDYLLSHHGVYRETSSTTKLRVVFNPNLVSISGQSLSKVLLVGPKLQLDIQDLLINFRLHPIAMTCDIQAMYRCILVAPEDRVVQHILWRPDSKENIQEFELKTVTFGLPPSPFLAQRVIKQLAIDEKDKFPEASCILHDSIYVDDIVTGSDSITSAKQLRNELISLLKAGGFSLRKWTSSHPEVLSDLSSELCETPHSLGSTESIKVLGIQWCPKLDSFQYCVKIEDNMAVTKRSVLSVIASIYDVNGFLSPVIVLMKIFMQKLWLNKNDTWDTPLPSHLHGQWCKLLKELPLLSNLQIPRYLLGDCDSSIQLVGFADASFDAFAACVYLRINQSPVKVQLLRAKTKVAPLKVQTINRLELCAAFLLAKVIDSLSFLIKKLNIKQIYLFSDSKTVLSWLKTQPHLLKTFVANRVVQILEWTDPSHWYHVTSEENSADPASRGLMPSQLLENKLWFNGPLFLLSDPQQWPLTNVKEPCSSLPELKSSNPVVLTVQSKSPNDLINVIKRFSSLGKLQRVFGYVGRFINNLKRPTGQRKSGHLSVTELQEAMHTLCRISQSVHLYETITEVGKNSIPSSMQSLSPRINSVGLLVVGGRLANAPIPEHAKHPILLPKQCHLTTLIIRNIHLQTLHGGPKIVQSLLQQRYWIINARTIIRSIIFQCVACAKLKAQTPQPIMADIPKSRFSQGRPFLKVGVDFAGPFTYKTGPRRNSPLDKGYLALFVCMATKCVHLEFVSSLSTPAFIATLDRFVGRRGLPQCIYSDNGTNFRGSASYLQEVQKFLRESNLEITNHLLTQEVTWSFIPPSAPNFGGLWEAGVKSAKLHLKHVLQGHALNFEEFTTLLVRIEAILNSRPLCTPGSNPNDGIDYLSPGHFLIGAPLIARPDSENYIMSSSLQRRWQLISQATHCFWKKWSNDYINTQIQRHKWSKPSKPIAVGDVVLIQTPSNQPQTWPLGRVISLLPGKTDSVVRVVEVKTQHGELVRPVSRLVPLPVVQ